MVWVAVMKIGGLGIPTKPPEEFIQQHDGNPSEIQNHQTQDAVAGFPFRTTTHCNWLLKVHIRRPRLR